MTSCRADAKCYKQFAKPALARLSLTGQRFVFTARLIYQQAVFASRKGEKEECTLGEEK